MKQFLSLTLLTGVYLLLTGGAWAEGAGSTTGYQIDPMKQAFVDACKDPAKRSPGESEIDCLVRLNSGQSSGKTCQTIQKDADDKLKEAGQTCAKAGMGGSSCIETLRTCNEAMETVEEPLMSNLYSTLGVSDSGGAAKRCPMSSTQIKDLKTDFKDANREFADLEKEMVKNRKDNQDKFSTLQKEISDTEQGYKDAQLTLKETLRKEDADKANSLSQISKNIESLNAQILKADTEHAKMLGDHALRMSEISDAIIQQDCVSAITKLAKDLSIISSTTNDSFVKRSSNKRKTLVERYNQCITAKNQMRSQLITNLNNQERELNYSISRMKADIDRQKEQLTLFQTQAAAAAQDAQQRKSDLNLKYQQDMARLANELQSLSQNSASDEANLTKRMYEKKKELNSASNSLGLYNKDIQVQGSDNYISAGGAYAQYVNKANDYLSVGSGCCDSTGTKGISTAGGSDSVCKRYTDSVKALKDEPWAQPAGGTQ